MDKREMMDQIKRSALELCERECDSGAQLVWGDGPLNAPLAIVGEAPGEQEDRFGRPFVGQAGELLNSELVLAGIRRETVYVTNVVKCRPTKLVGGRRVNRAPTTDEAAQWYDILINELSIIEPELILCLGAVAASSLIHSGFAMNVDRGQWFDGLLDTPIIATFHPAYVLRARQYGDQERTLHFRADLSAVVSELRTGRAAS